MATGIAFDLLKSFGGEVPAGFCRWAGDWSYRGEGIPVACGESRNGLRWLLVGTLLGELEPSAVVDAFLASREARELHAAGGQFWLVVWDAVSRTTEIYRDRTAILPLVYTRTRDGLLISMSLRTALHALDDAPSANPAVFDAWPLFRKTFAPDVTFTGITSLSAEHALQVEDDRIDERPLPMARSTETSYRSMQEAAESLGVALSSAVKRRVARAERLGALLSGGTDSSLVVALVREHFSGPLRTLFVTFDGNPRDYGQDAQEVARRFGSTHETLRIGPEQFAAEWPLTVEQLATPVPMPCHVGFRIAMSHLAGSVDTMIDGDGADTVFGSSLWLQGLALSAAGSVIPAPLRSRLADWSLRFGGTTARRLASMALQALGTPLARYPHVWASMIDEATHRRVFATGSWAAGIERRRGFTVSAGHFEEGLFSYLMLHGIPEDIATAVRLGMDNGIIFTYPFLDDEVLRASQRLPFRLRYHYRYRKLPLRTFARRYFSREFLFKPKEGFGVPLGTWYTRKPFARLLQLPLEERSLKRRWWNEGEVREIMRRHTDRAGNDDSAEGLPWIVANLELWARICLEGDRPELYC